MLSRLRLRSVPLVSAALILLPASRLAAVNIVLDYSYDTSGFFTTDYRAAAQAAANDWGRAITGPLGAISSAPVSATVGGSTLTTSVSYWDVRNPTTEAQMQLTGVNVAADTLRIYMGAKAAGTQYGGKATIAGTYVSSNFTAYDNATNARSAAEAATAQFSAVMSRGSGPRMTDTTWGNWTIGGQPYTPSSRLLVGNALGSITMNSDILWQSNYAAPLAPGYADFYTTMLHEIGHTLGIGGGASWENLVGADADGNGLHDWTGTNLIALKGTGHDLIGGDSGDASLHNHLADGVTGHAKYTLISTMMTGDVIPDVMTTHGGASRMGITDTDLAVLRDLGYTVVPEPGAYGAMAAAGLASVVLVRRRIRRIVTA